MVEAGPVDVDGRWRPSIACLVRDGGRRVTGTAVAQAEDRRQPVDAPDAVVASGFTCRLDDGRPAGLDLRAARCRDPPVAMLLPVGGPTTGVSAAGPNRCGGAPCLRSGVEGAAPPASPM